MCDGMTHHAILVRILPLVHQEPQTGSLSHSAARFAK